eukprot:CAMPEP_0206420380 /NCGR_PEP_ID=MMETSP0324_2-20121206/802_1 /ASSEMBLY_ACC=CAM_ASM_000836 /TAXON_ID=2866 /ORGANISM="Crypthecodinium cohnii, Strain Seligo" /LENGTH=119 /DNA_ID=CAMNT_0053884241 /DNA_START=498 /DNA_END=854 /DNA_ORIENTATION=-
MPADPRRAASLPARRQCQGQARLEEPWLKTNLNSQQRNRTTLPGGGEETPNKRNMSPGSWKMKSQLPDGQHSNAGGSSAADSIGLAFSGLFFLLLPNLSRASSNIPVQSIESVPHDCLT